MKKVLFITFLIAGAMNHSIQANYGVVIKQEADHLFEKVKSAGRQVYDLVFSKKQEEKAELQVAQVAHKESPAIIVESCEYCKDLVA